jgi:uncharacterized membrane protein
MEHTESQPPYEAPSVDLSRLSIAESPIIILPIAVILALGATLVIGMTIYCSLQGLTFTGVFDTSIPGYVRFYCA